MPGCPCTYAGAGPMCAASLFVGGDKSSFSDQSKWAGSAPTVNLLTKQLQPVQSGEGKEIDL